MSPHKTPRVYIMYSQIQFARRGWFDYHRDMLTKWRKDPEMFADQGTAILRTAPDWVGNKTEDRFLKYIIQTHVKMIERVG